MYIFQSLQPNHLVVFAFVTIFLSQHTAHILRRMCALVFRFLRIVTSFAFSYMLGSEVLIAQAKMFLVPATLLHRLFAVKVLFIAVLEITFIPVNLKATSYFFANCSSNPVSKPLSRSLYLYLFLVTWNVFLCCLHGAMLQGGAKKVMATFCQQHHNT